jgi:hypothetical protein
MREPTIIGILGFAHSGKDTISDILNEGRGYQRIAFADPLKRMCMQLFKFSIEQLWGKLKEVPDTRYPREHTWVGLFPGASRCACCGIHNEQGDKQCFLTPRYALQIMGTEGGLHCYRKIWTDITLADAVQITQESGIEYHKEEGTVDSGYHEGCPKRSVVITDVRFILETEEILKRGGQVYRIKRKGYEEPAYNHPSETEQLQILDDRLNGVILNNGGLEDLKDKVLALFPE